MPTKSSNTETLTRDQELLVRRFRAGNCVAFIGAGFSAPTGMPLWGQLLSNLIQRLMIDFRQGGSQDSLRTLELATEFINHGQFPRAASAIRAADISTQHIDGYLKEIFDSKTKFDDKQRNDTGKKQMQKRLRALLSLPWAGIVTTNYDTLVSDELFRRGVDMKSLYLTQASNLGQTLKSGVRPFVVHLHGNIANGRIILTEGDYDNAYLASSQLSDFLTVLLLRNTIMFIGTQVEDRFVERKRHLKLLFDQTGVSLPPDYVLLPDTDIDHLRGEYLNSTGTFVVMYYKCTKNRHEGFVPMLESIRDQLAGPERAIELDDVSKLLFKIIRNHPDGVGFAGILRDFWPLGARIVARYPDLYNLNDRELGYRLHYLINKNQVVYNEVKRTYQATRSSES